MRSFFLALIMSITLGNTALAAPVGFAPQKWYNLRPVFHISPVHVDLTRNLYVYLDFPSGRIGATLEVKRMHKLNFDSQKWLENNYVRIYLFGRYYF